MDVGALEPVGLLGVEAHEAVVDLGQDPAVAREAAAQVLGEPAHRGPPRDEAADRQHGEREAHDPEDQARDGDVLAEDRNGEGRDVAGVALAGQGAVVQVQEEAEDTAGRCPLAEDPAATVAQVKEWVS